MIERLARIETEARTLARSGRYFSSKYIELALVGRGFVEAPLLFRNLWTCSELDRLCARAFRERAARSGPSGVAGAVEK
jgi:hypothetical protein